MANPLPYPLQLSLISPQIRNSFAFSAYKPREPIREFTFVPPQLSANLEMDSLDIQSRQFQDYANLSKNAINRLISRKLGQN